jgi:uncharacterized protein (DUF1800 family)
MEIGMVQSGISLAAHLMRRAGFGSSNEELDVLGAKPYELIVDDLVHPERFPEVDEYALRRYFLQLNNFDTVITWQGAWVYRMVNTRRPLEEKMTLFWHHIFATSVGKSEHGPSAVKQIETFRANALGKFEEMIYALARDPAMIFWLDNNENHLGEPNENWGRELLELFSMGVGNYTEDDIKQASKAFTGWTFTQPLPLDPYGRYTSEFIYEYEDHDDSEKVFLGNTGRFDGGDIIKIVAKQSATASFIARHLYNFFVADESQVPAWSVTEPRDPAAVDSIAEYFIKVEGDMRKVLRFILLSDFFKNSVGERVKSPVELVVGIIKIAGTHRHPIPLMPSLGGEIAVMGQDLMKPPTVEGWHYGHEWIDGGTLNNRVNFAVKHVSKAMDEGDFKIGDLIKGETNLISAEDLVDRCLHYAGSVEVSEETRKSLIDSEPASGGIDFKIEENPSERIKEIVRLIVSTVDYQFA